MPNIEEVRYKMIEQQIRPWDVSDSTVLGLFSTIRREDFLPVAQKSLAFVDMAVALPAGQTMLQPRIQARLLQDAAVQPTDKVLEIGTGTGYMTALLARMAQRVLSLEINAELVELARANLQRAGITNVEVRHADGALGAPVEAPFDVIVLGGSVREMPQSLLKQLKVGGRLVGIVGSEPIMHGTVITRTGDAQFTSVQKWDDNAPALQGFAQPPAFKF